jgi:hypothetical protein
MDIPAKILDEAYAVFEEWGPDRLIERSERLGQVFGETLGSAELEYVLERMKEVSKTVWTIAEMGGEMKLGKARVTRLLQEKHPFLKKKGLARADTLVNYYTWHEGYDK